MKFAKGIATASILALTTAGVAWASCGDKNANVTKAAYSDEKLDIIDTAVEAGKFNTLAAAIQAAGLVEALKGDGPFTVFAPTDEAFAKLPEGTVETLLKPENIGQLQQILKFHVIAGDVRAEQVVGMTESSATLAGQTFRIKVKDGTVRIGNDKAMANVIATDVEATNGVIHVIDTVLLPE